MVSITVEVDTPEQVELFLRSWLIAKSPEGEMENITKAVRAMNGAITRAITTDVAEASMRGDALVLDAAYPARHGLQDTGQLGGAFAGVWRAFNKHVGRDVMEAASNPRRYWMKKQDAEIVLAAMRDSGPG